MSRIYGLYNPSKDCFLKECGRGLLFIHNKLSQKPQKAVKSIENIMQNQWKYNMSIRQDYSKNIVEMNLLDAIFGVYMASKKRGYQILQTKEIPVTAAVSTYTKAAKEMLDAEQEALMQSNRHLMSSKNKKSSFFQQFADKVKSFF